VSGTSAAAAGRPALAAVGDRSQLDPVEADREWLRAVGMRVLLARTAGRQSQEELGRRAGVSRVTVGSIERGDHPASVLAYVRLAAALRLAVGELLDGYSLPSAGGELGRVR
jgi:DNA-binding XRE family transcriptional regulator